MYRSQALTLVAIQSVEVRCRRILAPRHETDEFSRNTSVPGPQPTSRTDFPEASAICSCIIRLLAWIPAGFCEMPSTMTKPTAPTENQ
jgi:hypothetical protein